MFDVILSKHLAPIWFGVMVMFICTLIHSGGESSSYFTIIGATLAATLFMTTFMLFLTEMFAGIARITQAAKPAEADTPR
jgi:uncharacterized protein YybS (DUF2232 family)